MKRLKSEKGLENRSKSSEHQPKEVLYVSKSFHSYFIFFNIILLFPAIFQIDDIPVAVRVFCRYKWYYITKFLILTLTTGLLTTMTMMLVNKNYLEKDKQSMWDWVAIFPTTLTTTTFDILQIVNTTRMLQNSYYTIFSVKGGTFL